MRSTTLCSTPSPRRATWCPESSPYYDASLTLPEFDLEAAQALVDEYLADTGQDSFSFTYNAINFPASAAGAELIQAQLAQLDGVSVEINLMTTEQLVSQVVDKNFDVTAMSYRGVSPEPEFNEMFYSKGGRNLTGYVNDIVDSAIETVRTTSDLEAQREAYATAAQQLAEDMPFILLSRDSSSFAFTDAVHGVEAFEDGGLLSDRVWLSGS